MSLFFYEFASFSSILVEEYYFSCKNKDFKLLCYDKKKNGRGVSQVDFIKEETDAVKTALKLEECLGENNIYLKYINEEEQIGFIAHKKNEEKIVVLRECTDDGVVPITIAKKTVESLWKQKLLVHCGIDHMPVANKAACKTEYLGVRIRTDLFRGI